MSEEKGDWPKTVEEAAASLIGRMSAEDKQRVRETRREELILYHHGWGTGIRSALSLWKGNDALLASSGAWHPDDCSMRIIERVWEKLQESARGSEAS